MKRGHLLSCARGLGAVCSKRREDTTYVAMIDWDRYDLQYLPQRDGKSLDAIRVVFPHGKHKEGIAVGKEIAKKEYQVFSRLRTRWHIQMKNSWNWRKK